MEKSIMSRIFSAGFLSLSFFYSVVFFCLPIYNFIYYREFCLRLVFSRIFIFTHVLNSGHFKVLNYSTAKQCSKYYLIYTLKKKNPQSDHFPILATVI